MSVPEPVLTPVWIDSHSLIPRMVGRPGNEAMIPTHHTGSDVHLLAGQGLGTRVGV